jgi:hypothetical protein
VNAAAAVHVAKASHARYLGHTWTAKQAVPMPFDMYRRSMLRLWGDASIAYVVLTQAQSHICCVRVV